MTISQFLRKLNVFALFFCQPHYLQHLEHRITFIRPMSVFVIQFVRSFNSITNVILPEGSLPPHLAFLGHDSETSLKINQLLLVFCTNPFLVPGIECYAKYILPRYIYYLYIPQNWPA
jgi:hypothetical protein